MGFKCRPLETSISTLKTAGHASPLYLTDLPLETLNVWYWLDIQQQRS